MVYNPGYEVYPSPDSAILTGLASIHLVNLSTMTSKYFFLMGPTFKGSDHVKPPDHKRPGDGYSLECGVKTGGSRVGGPELCVKAGW